MKDGKHGKDSLYCSWLPPTWWRWGHADREHQSGTNPKTPARNWRSPDCCHAAPSEQKLQRLTVALLTVARSFRVVFPPPPAVRPRSWGNMALMTSIFGQFDETRRLSLIIAPGPLEAHLMELPHREPRAIIAGGRLSAGLPCKPAWHGKQGSRSIVNARQVT